MVHGALPSNAGNLYHFVYAARRMLDMLHPRSDLNLIVMENVAEEDLQLADTPETFLGVDLTEYYGDSNCNEVRRIVVVQVKYSPTHPIAKWTLSRLCTDKISSTGNPKPGTSILRKLSNAFKAFYARYGNETNEKVQVKLHTNQSLDEDLREYLLQAKSLVEGKNNLDGSQLLQKTEGELRKVLNRVQKTTKLSWKQVATFLKCWDLSSFGQAMLSVADAELLNLLSQYTSKAGVYVGGLIDFVQDHAGSNRSTEITPQMVYAQLGLRQTDFFPAPTFFPEVKGLQFTEATKSLMGAIETMQKGILLFHGISGSGKSTALQFVHDRYGDGNSTVIYDCYAGGKGLHPGSERFPYNKCFVQIINELDHLFHTNILATTSLNYDHLMQQFNDALSKAAGIAQSRGHRLVIAFDAIDNAVYAVSRVPIHSAEPFVPLLWNIDFPENCVVIISSRTENLPDLNIECEYREIEIEGFTQKETEEYICFFWIDVSDDLAGHIHKRTNGNPRVQSKLIERANRESPSDLFTFVNTVARETAFEYYRSECPVRLKSEDDKLTLAVLLEATPPISLKALSGIMGKRSDRVRATIESLYFGLHISDDNEILWRDQDFLDFSRSYVESKINEAHCVLAEYCQNNYGKVNYATANLSRHFYSAGRYEQLLNWWLEDDRLAGRIKEAKPYEEDVLVDIQYGLLAAIRIEQFSAALKLLSLAADIIQGRDVFSAEIKDYPLIAIECGYIDRLLEFLKERESDHELADNYFSIARVLAERGEQLDLAKELVVSTWSLTSLRTCFLED